MMSYGLVIHHRNVFTNVKDRARQTDRERQRQRKRQRERDTLMVYCLWFKISSFRKGDKVNEF